jgi:hypothetical protein
MRHTAGGNALSYLLLGLMALCVTQTACGGAADSDEEVGNSQAAPVTGADPGGGASAPADGVHLPCKGSYLWSGYWQTSDNTVHSDPSQARTELARGESLWSCDGRFRLWLQETDGNLVFYQNGVGPLWASGVMDRIWGELVESAFLTDYGHMEVRYRSGDERDTTYIRTSSPRKDQAILIAQDDGNLVIYPYPGARPEEALWASKTAYSN